KQIYIEPEQEERLKRLAAETGITEAEIIRDAIDQHLLMRRSPRRNLSAWEAELAFIRQLIQAGPVPGGRTWRREDLYDR
ncbi:MAG: ribbon-helix-helix domain-containing protein, partial [Chloroflexi bacterium]|nr:ribbon-helix-helix domain-containing protein [Chloroflexota bacterium]